jgi:LPXTG-site transpeptidase (sortase) family protein
MMVAPLQAGSMAFALRTEQVGQLETGGKIITLPLVDKLNYLTNKELPQTSAVSQLSYHTTTTLQTQPQNTAPQASGTSVSTTSEKDRFDHIDSNAPRYINIPAIGLSADVTTLGIKDGTAKEVDAPKELQNTGWFNRSAKPSEAGAVFIDGHTPGVFSNLVNLKAGDKITVKTATGQVYDYQVKKVETKKNTEIKMRDVLKPLAGYDKGLNLMTCAGSKVNGSYDSRTIVWAVLEG